MSRTLTGAMSTALAAGHVVAVYLVDLQFTSGTQRVNTGGTPIVWNGNTYLGAGRLAIVETIRETVSGEAVGLKLGLSSIPATLLPLALSEHVQGRPAEIRLALLNESTRQVIADPSLEFRGLIDAPTINEDGQSAQISITVENRAANPRPRPFRFNDATQQSRYPGDGFFKSVARMVEAEIVWPSSTWRP